MRVQLVVGALAGWSWAGQAGLEQERGLGLPFVISALGEKITAVETISSCTLQSTSTVSLLPVNS